LTGIKRQRRTKRVYRYLGLAILQGLFSTRQPSVGQLNLVGSVRLVEIIGQHGQQRRDREQRNQGQRIGKKQTSPPYAVVGG